MRTNSAQSAEFYEAIGVPGVPNGAIMFSMSVQQFSAPALEIDAIAEESHKKFYSSAWEKFLAGQQQVIEVAEENEQAASPETQEALPGEQGEVTEPAPE